MTDYFSEKGRLNRWPYFSRYIGCIILFSLPILLLEASEYLGDFVVIIVFFVLIVGLIPAMIISIFMLMQSIQRLHDLNKSGWYLLILFAYPIPYLGEIIVLGFVLYLFLAKGTSGPNRFGPDPLRREAGDSNYSAQSLNSEVVDAEYEEDRKQK